MKITYTSSRPININDSDLEKLPSFVYLGITVHVKKGTDEVTFPTKQTSGSSCILLYGSEKWKIAKSSNNKIQTFVNGQTE